MENIKVDVSNGPFRNLVVLTTEDYGRMTKINSYYTPKQARFLAGKIVAKAVEAELDNE